MFSPWIMKTIDRRPQYFTAVSIVAFCLFSLGLLTYVESSSSIIMFIPIPFLLMFAFSYGIGVGPVSYCVPSELFPQEMKTLGCSLAYASRYLMVGMDLKLYSILLNLVGMGGVYILHAGIMVLGILFFFYFLPETRNKSFTELEKLFDGNVPG